VAPAAVTWFVRALRRFPVTSRLRGQWGQGLTEHAEIMIRYGRSPEDIRRWPGDPAARRALESYFETLPGDSLDITVQLDGRGLDFTGADLSGLELGEAEFSEATLRGVNLAGADLYGAWLMGAILRDADLSECSLRKAKGRTCDAQGANFCGADFQRSEFEESDFRRANLTKVRFGGAFLHSADLRGGDLRECTFGLNGRSTGFHEARLANCRVDGATGTVFGPIDVGVDSPRLLDGDDLQRWFTDHGAPLVEVWRPARI
jgi:uncharacterized protein YjbI with pentapeptide repeats